MRFVLVAVGGTDTPAEVAEFAAKHGFDGPVLDDRAGAIAAHLAGRTTTEAFVVDATGTLVYRGAVSDQYGTDYALDAPRRAYLADAL